MKQFLGLVLIFIFGINIKLSGENKDVQVLPQDPRVKTGKLANGLTYYVFKNTAIKGCADFAVVQKVGTVLEKNNQKGMCKLLELLATRGTRNFNDSTIVKYLNSIGVVSKDIIFKTEEDKIQYTIKNVPLANPNTMDSVLLIMYNWMSSINIDKEDITQVVPMLKTTIKNEWNAEKRMDDKIIKTLFPDSPYAKSITLNQINTMQGFSSKELRNFYYDWFRSNLQAVVVVGDVDLNTVETQIKSIFATIPKPMVEKQREYYTPEIFEGTKVVLENDPEYDKILVSINFLKKPLIEKYRETSIPYIESFFDSTISSLLYSRIQSGIVAQNLPIYNLKIEKGNFINISNLNTFSISFETQPTSVYSALSFISMEIEKMARYGLNGQEFTKSRDVYFRELEHVYDNRFSQQNSLFMQRVVNHFLNGFSLASIEMHFEIMKEIIYSISSKQLNSYIEALLGKKDGVVITCKMPDLNKLDILSEERIKSSFTNSLVQSSALLSNDVIVKWPEFQNYGKVASINQEIHHNNLNIDEIVLSNGVRAILKKTGNLDTILFKAISKGGLNFIDKDYDYNILNFINSVANLGGLDNLSYSDWNKLFMYNNLNVISKINNNTEELYGYSGTSSFENLLQVINLNFTKRREDKEAFNIYKQSMLNEIKYRNIYPLNMFKDSVNFYNNKKNKSLTLDYINNVNYNNLYNVINERFSNAADFTFIFTGNIDYQEFKKLIVKYLGSIKTNSNMEQWLEINDSKPQENIDKNFLAQMIIPKAYIDFSICSDMDYSLENYIMSKMLEKYLSLLYSNGKIKELSPISKASIVMEYYPKNRIKCESIFETDNTSIKEVKDFVEKQIYKLYTEQISEKDFEQIITFVKENYKIQSKDNNFWMDILTNKVLTNKDFYTNYIKTIEDITPDKFRTFIEKIYRRGAITSVVMEGTTEDVNTQNLFRENEMIKEYFNL